MLRVACHSYVLLELIWTAKEKITTQIIVSQQGKVFDWEGILVTKLEDTPGQENHLFFIPVQVVIVSFKIY